MEQIVVQSKDNLLPSSVTFELRQIERFKTMSINFRLWNKKKYETNLNPLKTFGFKLQSKKYNNSRTLRQYKKNVKYLRRYKSRKRRSN